MERKNCSKKLNFATQNGGEAAERKHQNVAWAGAGKSLPPLSINGEESIGIIGIESLNEILRYDHREYNGLTVFELLLAILQLLTEITPDAQALRISHFKSFMLTSSPAFSS